MTTYLLAGGGTAGHVNPLLAVADGLSARNLETTIYVLGTAEGLESRLVPERGYQLLTIPRVPFPRRPNRAAVMFPQKFSSAVDQVVEIIRNLQVDVVIGFGGYVSTPAYLAARRLKVPVVIHEANARPGLANRLGARSASRVGVAFAGTKLKGAQVVGMPLRREIESLDRSAFLQEALNFFELDGARPVLLVTGGSLGAKHINETISGCYQPVVDAGWQVLHITGEKSPVPVASAISGVRVITYADRMDLALAAADFAISRAGAATVSELAALGIPAVYVPYPVGNGEQRFNAAGLVTAGGGLLVADAEFTPSWVQQNLIPLLVDRQRVASMAAAAAKTGVRDGTTQMIKLIDQAFGGGSPRRW